MTWYERGESIKRIRSLHANTRVGRGRHGKRSLHQSCNAQNSIEKIVAVQTSYFNHSGLVSAWLFTMMERLIYFEVRFLPLIEDSFISHAENGLDFVSTFNLRLAQDFDKKMSMIIICRYLSSYIPRYYRHILNGDKCLLNTKNVRQLARQYWLTCFEY